MFIGESHWDCCHSMLRLSFPNDGQHSKFETCFISSSQRPRTSCLSSTILPVTRCDKMWQKPGHGSGIVLWKLFFHQLQQYGTLVTLVLIKWTVWLGRNTCSTNKMHRTCASLLLHDSFGVACHYGNHASTIKINQVQQVKSCSCNCPGPTVPSLQTWYLGKSVPPPQGQTGELRC